MNGRGAGLAAVIRRADGWGSLGSGGLRSTPPNRNSTVCHGLPHAVDVEGGRQSISDAGDLDGEVNFRQGGGVGPGQVGEPGRNVEDLLIAEPTTQERHEGNRGCWGGSPMTPSAGETLCDAPHDQIVGKPLDATMS